MSRQVRIVAVPLKDAQVFVTRHHRHHPAPAGHKFSLAAIDVNQVRHGVAIVGRPVARHLDDGRTLEATRICADGTPNICSALLAAAWRATKALGYQRLITYTQISESGASLRGAGWHLVANLRPRKGWSSPGRIRCDQHPTRVPRQRWEVTTPDYPAPDLRHTEHGERDESPPSTCRVCAGPLPTARTGRPARYCSAACRQAAYRYRHQQRPSTRRNAPASQG